MDLIHRLRSNGRRRGSGISAASTIPGRRGYGLTGRILSREIELSELVERLQHLERLTQLTAQRAA